MSDFQSSIQRMLDQLDPPVLKAIREASEKFDQLKSPAFQHIMESQRTLHKLINEPEFVKVVRLLKYHNTLLPKEISYFSEIAATTASYNQTLQLLKRLNLKDYDFETAEDDDLELTSYELIPESNLTVPDTKIILLNEVSHIQKTIAAIYKDNAQLYHIHHREFEEMMAELLKSRDFEVFLTKKTRDGGTDIIALQNHAGIPIKMLVECKKYAPARKIGVDVIRGFSYVVNTKQANKGIIFTTSYFTADARKEQQQYMPYLLDLNDYHDVINWINAYVE
jgi:HJR/Mrr/RecB family endonuclease